jgi:hypothetical protein
VIFRRLRCWTAALMLGCPGVLPRQSGIRNINGLGRGCHGRLVCERRK